MTMKEVFYQRKLNRRQLRERQTVAEKRLWRRLRDAQLGARFRRQFSIGRYVADFYAYHNRLVIEVDGGIHNEPKQKEYDDIRTNYLEKIGCKVLRFTNEQVLNEIEHVIGCIRSGIESP